MNFYQDSPPRRPNILFIITDDHASRARATITIPT